MKYYVSDLRYDSTKEVLDSVARALKSLPEGKPEWFDGLFILEHAEELVGVAFAAAQVYLNSALSVLSKATGRKLDKKFRTPLLQHGEVLDLFPSVCKIEVIYAAANYWKHHDEWENWKPNGRNRDTIETLAKVEVNDETEFPCNRIATLLGGEDYSDLNWLLEAVSVWRRDAMARHNLS
jgi:hypothetical protein